MSQSILNASLFVAIAASSAFAQTIITPNGTALPAIPAQAAVVSVAGGLTNVGFIGGLAGSPMNAIAGQPFSAQEETERVQTLGDGTHITSGTQKVMHYRDSLGRTRTERTALRPPGFPDAAAPPVFIEITDSVAGYRYTFDSNNKTAHRSPFNHSPVAKVSASPPNGAVVQPQYARVTPAAPMNSRPQRPEISTEKLGTQTIEGLLVEGVRVTSVFAVGTLGNDRPITAVNEIWTSRELGMAVLSKMSDPRIGDSITKLTNVSRAEPDASLFQPPAGYEIVDPSNQAIAK